MSAPHQTPLSGGYDQSLLAAAPEASKAARQEGYNVDLLDERRGRGTVTPPTAPPSRPRTTEPDRSKENYSSLESPRGGGAAPRKEPFWRTRKGIITIAVLAIVIVGAVVGGAVGGTVGNNKNSSAATQPEGKGPPTSIASSTSSSNGAAPGGALGSSTPGPDASKSAQSTTTTTTSSINSTAK